MLRTIVDEALAYMMRGGAFMWPILLVSVCSLTFACERIYVLWYRYRLNVDRFVDQLIDLMEQQKFSYALEVCHTESRHPLAVVAKAGIVKANCAEREIQRAMEAAALRLHPQITKRVGYLAMLANVATLLGLLGTVSGLVEAFAGIAEADVVAKQEILAKGIAVAMSTTALGLMTAIPALVAYAILTDRQNNVVAQLESKATELLNYLVSKSRSVGRQGG